MVAFAQAARTERRPLHSRLRVVVHVLENLASLLRGAPAVQQRRKDHAVIVISTSVAAVRVQQTGRIVLGVFFDLAGRNGGKVCVRCSLGPALEACLCHGQGRLDLGHARLGLGSLHSSSRSKDGNHTHRGLTISLSLVHAHNLVYQASTERMMAPRPLFLLYGGVGHGLENVPDLLKMQRAQATRSRAIFHGGLDSCTAVRK